MGTGLFSTSTSQGIGARAHQRRIRKNYRIGVLDDLADLLAEHDLSTGHKGGDVIACARKLGVSYAYANAMLQRIRKKLGAQAR